MADFSHAWWLVVHPVQRSFLLCWFLQESEISRVEQLGGKTSLLIGLKAGRRRRPLFSASSKGRREEGDSAFIRSLPAAGVPEQERRPCTAAPPPPASTHPPLPASSPLHILFQHPPPLRSASSQSLVRRLCLVSQSDWLPCRLQPYFCLPSMWWACITEALKFYVFIYFRSTVPRSLTNCHVSS